MDPRAAQPRVEEAARALGDVTSVDAVPFRVDAAAWATVARGLVQRVRALEAFLADAHGPRRAERDGLIASSHYFEPDVPPPPKRRLAVTGHDLVRDRDGRWWVLEDNIRTPGLLYGVAARHALAAAGAAPDADRLEAGLARALRAALRDASRVAAPEVVALVDADAAPANRFEVETLCRLAGARVATHAELEVRAGRLLHEGRPVDVVWHRTAEDRLRGDDGAPTALGAVLLEPLRAGTVAVVNHPGSGLADDKRTGVHVPDLIRGLLGEEPVLAQPPGAEASTVDLEGLVVKGRASAGGAGVAMRVDGPPPDAEERIAQARVEVAPEPVAAGGTLEPRAADVRAHVLVADAGACVMPSVARHASAPGEARVNASLGGGVKALWVA